MTDRNITTFDEQRLRSEGKLVETDDPMRIGPLETGRLNHDFVASPDNLPAKIDAAASEASVGSSPDWRVVGLQAKEYTQTNLSTQPGVLVDANGAIFRPGSDDEVWFIDNGSALINARFDSGSSYTSSFVSLDTNRSKHGKYAVGASTDNTHAVVDIQADGAGPSGEAVELNDEAAQGITVGTRLSITSSLMSAGIAVRGNPSNGDPFINPTVDAQMLGNAWAVDIKDDVRADMTITGSCQAGGAVVEGGFRNQGTQVGPRFDGGFYDPQNANTSAIDGSGIMVRSKTANIASIAQGNAPNMGAGSGIFSFHVGGGGNKWQFLDDDENLWEKRFSGGSWEFMRNGTTIFTMDLNGDVSLRSSIHSQRGDPTTSELDAGENMVYNSDGSGTGSSGDLVYAVNASGTIKTLILAQVSNAT